MPDDEPTTSGNLPQQEFQPPSAAPRRTDKEVFTAFLSLPHEFGDLRKEIIATLETLTDFAVHCEYVTQSGGHELRAEVTEKLRRCDFIIGDVSSRPAH